MALEIEGRVAGYSDVAGDVNVDGDVTASLGSVNINVTDEVTSVGHSSEATIATLTANGINRITQIVTSGDIYAKYRVYINSTLKITVRSGPDRNVVVNFGHPLTLTSGDVLDVKVEHYATGTTADFEASIIGFKEA